jgi:CheY-like chemotaxis protein
MKILFIDDQEEVREIICMILEDVLNASVESFKNTIDARAYLEENDQEVSLIICDYKLPKETGLEFYEKVKDLKIPFILMTGMYFEEGDERIKTFIQSSINKILYKPIDEDDLIREINYIL